MARRTPPSLINAAASAALRVVFISMIPPETDGSPAPYFELRSRECEG